MTRLISCFVAIFVLATHAYAERSIDPIMGLMRLDQQKFSALPHGDLGPVNAPRRMQVFIPRRICAVCQ